MDDRDINKNKDTQLTVYSKTPFSDQLKRILQIAEENPSVELNRLLTLLSGKGYATLILFLSFPFCTPLQIPGFSTPFGILLGFLGLRIAFGKRLWWPSSFLKKNIKSQYLIKPVKLSIKVVEFLQKFLRPRLLFLTQATFFKRLNGVVIFILACFLSLPLPIPMTNLFSAFPIFCIGLGLLEDDGIAILIGYLFAFIASAVFISLFLFGYDQLKGLFG